MAITFHSLNQGSGPALQGPASHPLPTGTDLQGQGHQRKDRAEDSEPQFHPMIPRVSLNGGQYT